MGNGGIGQRVALGFWPPVAVFGLHVLRQVFLPGHDSWDVWAHFLGGLSIAWAARNVYRALQRAAYVPVLPAGVSFVFLISVAMCVGVLWEMMEYFILWPLNPSLPFTYADTMGDFVADLAGALTFSIYALGQRKKYDGS